MQRHQCKKQNKTTLRTALAVIQVSGMLGPPLDVDTNGAIMLSAEKKSATVLLQASSMFM